MGRIRLYSGGTAKRLLSQIFTRPTIPNAPFLPLSSKSPFSTLTQIPFLSFSTSRIRRATHDALTTPRHKSTPFGLRAIGTEVPDVPNPLVAENERKRHEPPSTLVCLVLTPKPNQHAEFYREVARDLESFLTQAFQGNGCEASKCDRHPVRSPDRHRNISRALCPLRPGPSPSTS